MLLLEQNITRKERVDEALQEPEKDVKFEARGNETYEVKVIINNIVYN